MTELDEFHIVLSWCSRSYYRANKESLLCFCFSSGKSGAYLSPQLTGTFITALFHVSFQGKEHPQVADERKRRGEEKRSHRSQFFYPASKFFHGDWGPSSQGPSPNKGGEGHEGSFLPVRHLVKSRTGRRLSSLKSRRCVKPNKGLTWTSSKSKVAARFSISY